MGEGGGGVWRESRTDTFKTCSIPGTGLEPVTFGTTARRSSQLSYPGIYLSHVATAAWKHEVAGESVFLPHSTVEVNATAPPSDIERGSLRSSDRMINGPGTRNQTA